MLPQMSINKDKSWLFLDDDEPLLCMSIVNRRMSGFDVRTLRREEKLASTVWCTKSLDLLLGIGTGHGDKPGPEGSDPR